MEISSSATNKLPHQPYVYSRSSDNHARKTTNNTTRAGVYVHISQTITITHPVAWSTEHLPSVSTSPKCPCLIGSILIQCYSLLYPCYILPNPPIPKSPRLSQGPFSDDLMTPALFGDQKKHQLLRRFKPSCPVRHQYIQTIPLIQGDPVYTWDITWFHEKAVLDTQYFRVISCSNCCFVSHVLRIYDFWCTFTSISLYPNHNHIKACGCKHFLSRYC